MIKTIVTGNVIVCALWATTVCGKHGDTATPASPPAATPAPAPTIGLKDAFAGKVSDWDRGRSPGGYSEAELANIKANYNVVTPENCMKPQPTHPSEDTYNFGPGRAGQVVRGQQHQGLGPHAGLARADGPWFFQGTNGQPVTRELAMARLKNHIMTVVGHYKGRSRAGTWSTRQSTTGGDTGSGDGKPAESNWDPE